MMRSGVGLEACPEAEQVTHVLSASKGEDLVPAYVSACVHFVMSSLAFNKINLSACCFQQVAL